MLNEGWDVLNLFDIVRLYDTRDGKWTRSGTYVPGKTTISEQQLIGRGARYFPFKTEDWQEASKRKFDEESDNPLRLCETLIYHCTTDNRYITEIRLVLKESGLVSSIEPTKIELKLKENFKAEKFYKIGQILVNNRVEKNRREVNSLPSKFRSIPVEYSITPSAGNTVALFDVIPVKTAKKVQENFRIKDLPLNVLLKGIRQFPILFFDKLLVKFPNLKSVEEFIFNENYLGKMEILISYPEGYQYNNEDLLSAYVKLLNEVSIFISKIEVQYEGTLEFKEEPVSKYIRDLVTYREIQIGSTHGEGISQSLDDQYQFDLSNEDWYAYNDNYGTSEEKSFVKYFASTVCEFKKKYTKVFLIRNEQQFGIYSFKSGERFEPDYILVLGNGDPGRDTVFYQVFIEPKGNQFIGSDGTFASGKEGWKEAFLKEIVEKNIEHKVFIDSSVYKIWGLPFYNESNTLAEFDSELKKLVN
jgi:type III restriction enzyme